MLHFWLVPLFFLFLHFVKKQLIKVILLNHTCYQRLKIYIDIFFAYVYFCLFGTWFKEKLKNVKDYATCIPKQQLTIHYTHKLHKNLNLFAKIDSWMLVSKYPVNLSHKRATQSCVLLCVVKEIRIISLLK